MPKSIWLKTLSDVYDCDLGHIGSEVSVTKRKVLLRIMGGRHLVSWTKLFFYILQMYKNYPFLTIFLKRLVSSIKEDFLLLYLFAYFFRHISSLAEKWLQLTLSSTLAYLS